MLIEPSWEVFKDCPKCFAVAGDPCYKLYSTSKNLVVCAEPHRGRKKKKK